jgi:GNAT superfamily N-acetyltransferase
MLNVKPVTTEAEYRAARALSLSIFSAQPPDPQTLEASLRRRLAQPGFDFAWHRIGVLEGEVVAHAVVLPYRLRYGSAEFTVGGIGAVCTHPDHRHKGYASAVMADSVAYMQARGDHFSLLNSAPEDFYTPFGYQTVWPDHVLEIDVEAAANLDMPLTLRPGKPEDAEAMAALYAAQWGQRVAMVRSLETWQWRMAVIPPQHVYIVENHNGRIVGYSSSGNKDGQYAEVVAETPEAVHSLLANAGRICQENGEATVKWVVPPDDRVIVYIRRLTRCRLTTYYFRSSQWMGRIVDASGFRAALWPEIMRQTNLDERGFIFSIQPDAIYMGLRGQDTTNVQLTHRDFLQLMFGGLAPDMLHLHPDAAQLLADLFPPRTAMLAPWDWF